MTKNVLKKEEPYVVPASSYTPNEPPPVVIPETDCLDIGEILLQDRLEEKERNRLHKEKNHHDSQKPGKYTHIHSRPQLRKLLLEVKSIPWGDVPDNVRKLLKSKDPDFCIEKNQLKATLRLRMGGD